MWLYDLNMIELRNLLFVFQRALMISLENLFQNTIN